MSVQRADLPAPLAETLDAFALAAAEFTDPWWIFGSCAAVLAGVGGLEPPDVDVLAGAGDAGALLVRSGVSSAADGGSALFRSVVFGRLEAFSPPVEVMAGLDVRTGDGWRPVQFETRRPIPWGEHALFIPEPAEQAAVLRLFGRPKDLARARLLDRVSEAA